MKKTIFLILFISFQFASCTRRDPCSSPAKLVSMKVNLLKTTEDTIHQKTVGYIFHLDGTFYYYPHTGSCNDGYSNITYIDTSKNEFYVNDTIYFGKKDWAIPPYTNFFTHQQYSKYRLSELLDFPDPYPDISIKNGMDIPFNLGSLIFKHKTYTVFFKIVTMEGVEMKDSVKVDF